jgi:hypothetical protein
MLEPLPKVLRDIEDDGRRTKDIIAALETANVAVFHKDIFARCDELTPPPGTVYQFLGALCRELPKDIRSSADQIFATAAREYGSLRKPPLRSALLLMERMTQQRLYAEIIVMNDVVTCHDGSEVLIALGREDADGQSWVAAVGTDYDFPHDTELVLFLAPPS